MTDTPTPPEQTPRGSSRAWATVRAALSKTPGRPGDQRIFWATRQLAELVAKLGLPVVLSLLFATYLVVTAPTKAQMDALAAAVTSDARVRAEQHNALVSSLDRTGKAIDASATAFAATTAAINSFGDTLDRRLSQMDATTEWLKGAVTSRLRCPPCPTCPPCPPATVHLLPPPLPSVPSPTPTPEPSRHIRREP